MFGKRYFDPVAINRGQSLKSRIGASDQPNATLAGCGYGEGARRLAENLASHREQARLYRQLTTLRTDLPLAESVDDLEWRGTHEGFKELWRSWGPTISRIAYPAGSQNRNNCPAGTQGTLNYLNFC